MSSLGKWQAWPSFFLHSDSLSALTSDGIKSLRLEHVHGYRGFDARNNVRYIDQGKESGCCLLLVVRSYLQVFAHWLFGLYLQSASSTTQRVLALYTTCVVTSRYAQVVW